MDLEHPGIGEVPGWDWDGIGAPWIPPRAFRDPSKPNSPSEKRRSPSRYPWNRAGRESGMSLWNSTPSIRSDPNSGNAPGSPRSMGPIPGTADPERESSGSPVEFPDLERTIPVPSSPNPGRTRALPAPPCRASGGIREEFPANPGFAPAPGRDAESSRASLSLDLPESLPPLRVPPSRKIPGKAGGAGAGSAFPALPRNQIPPESSSGRLRAEASDPAFPRGFPRCRAPPDPQEFSSTWWGRGTAAAPRNDPGFSRPFRKKVRSSPLPLT